MTALAACRFAHFLAVILAFGVSFFLWAYCSDGLRRNLALAGWRIIAASSVVALITAVLWLAAVLQWAGGVLQRGILESCVI